MYDESEIDRLIAAMRASGTTMLAVRAGAKRLRLVLPEGAPPAPAAEAKAAGPAPQDRVTAPAIGRFLPRGADDGLPALAPGAAVGTGEPLGYVASGAALVVVSAPRAGRLGDRLPAPGQVCGYGDILFTIEAPR